MSERSLALLESLAIAGAASASGVNEPCEIVREITASDIPVVLQELREHNWSRAASPGNATDVRVLRVGHHQLAQLLAGGVGEVEASYVTGKSVTTVRSLLHDPAFKELVSYYTDQQRERDLNVYARLTTIGALASEILQERLEESPEKFTNNELRQLLEIAAPAKGNEGSSRAPSGLAVSINFLPAPESHDPRLERGHVVEATVVSEDNKDGERND